MSAKSPLELQILLHYYYSQEDHPSAIRVPDSAMLQHFVQKGLIRKSSEPGRIYEGVKEVLSVYVEALQSVPFPVKEWKIPTS